MVGGTVVFGVLYAVISNLKPSSATFSAPVFTILFIQTGVYSPAFKLPNSMDSPSSKKTILEPWYLGISSKLVIGSGVALMGPPFFCRMFSDYSILPLLNTLSVPTINSGSGIGIDNKLYALPSGYLILNLKEHFNLPLSFHNGSFIQFK